METAVTKATMPDLKPVKPQPMEGWYNPKQLAMAAREVLISTIVGKHADQRLMEALADRTPESSDYFDYTKSHLTERNEIAVDFIADVGDGWNSTYATAYYLSQPLLEVTDPAGQKHTTKRAEILIFGGDQVYPTASREEYELRCVAPYETALAQTRPPYPHMFALPGNHYWYETEARMIPDDPRATPPRLIEKPFCVGSEAQSHVLNYPTGDDRTYAA